MSGTTTITKFDAITIIYALTESAFLDREVCDARLAGAADEKDAIARKLGKVHDLEKLAEERIAYHATRVANRLPSN